LLRGDIDNLRLAQVMYDQGVSAEALAAKQIAPEVCGYLHALESSRAAATSAAMANPQMQPILIEPPIGIGSGEDFDSTVADGWPDAPASGKAVPIMKARIAYGQRVVDALLDDAGSPLRRVLDKAVVQI